MHKVWLEILLRRQIQKLLRLRLRWRAESKIILKTLTLSFSAVIPNWAVWKKTLSNGTRVQRIHKRLLILRFKRSVSKLLIYVWHLVLRLVCLRHLDRPLHLVSLGHSVISRHSKTCLSKVIHKWRLIVEVHCFSHWRIGWSFVSIHRFLEIIDCVLINLINSCSISVKLKRINILLRIELVCH